MFVGLGGWASINKTEEQETIWSWVRAPLLGFDTPFCLCSYYFATYALSQV